ncbi:hypothetical protein I0K01_21720 [Xanthomonas oryzae pv. oryzae]|uniref:DUF6708 domain-containing protein n=1 Tax=Xanthomonas oryzae TaxID=347 RepID=UPI0011F24869|nr:DUF6708 domain-containing protein [Xanthomonas oryzae]UBB94719.1 hypothetical protein K2I41_10570 [Xanthomonas oryzae pv. oryzicola]WGY42686.1 hypothetical protein HED68_10285 [Xanthomonas oryzae pv. oryzicola]
MYTGWIGSKFPLNRVLSEAELDNAFSKRDSYGFMAQRLGLIRINSKYIEWIDRRFLYRGMMNTSVFLGGCILMVGGIFVCLDLFFSSYGGTRFFLAMPIATAILGILLFFFSFLRYDFFSYTYYPIRFNRENRKIYIFREERDGGLLVVPWEDVFFHIGRGKDMKFLRDIRGEILDGEIVKDTFALGHCAERDEPVKEMWEFIRRYMEEGPEAVAEHPLDKYVELSVAPTWKNCLISAVGFTNATTPFKRVLLFPFIGTFTVVRWLVFKSCKQPVFPPEVEAECQVEPNDPHIWPIPNSIGEFVTTVPGLMSYAIRKAQGIRTPPDAPSDLASQFKDWGKK